MTLEDDLSFFRRTMRSTSSRRIRCQAYPELQPLLARMDNMLSDEEMGQLNYQVDVEGKDSAEWRANGSRKGLIPSDRHVRPRRTGRPAQTGRRCRARGCTAR